MELKPFMAWLSWTCSKNIKHCTLLGLRMWMLIAAEPVYLICIKQHYSASQSNRLLKISQEQGLSSLCKHQIICGLFAQVWLIYMFLFKYRRWKGSTDNMYGTEIYLWLDYIVFLWLIVLIRWCRGECGLLFELIKCRGDPSEELFLSCILVDKW